MRRTSITGGDRTFEFVCLTSFQELDNYWSHWGDLARNDPRRTIFNSPEMFTAIRAARRDAAQLHIVFVHCGGEVVACAPMVISREKIKRIPCRTLKFFTRRADCLAPEDRRQLAEALVLYWRKISSQWDVLALEEMPGDSETLRVLETAVSNWRGCRSLPVGPRDAESFLATEGSWEDYTHARSGHFRRRWSRLQRDVDAQGTVSIVNIRGADNVESALQEMFALEERSWKLSAGTRLTEGEKALFRELAVSGGNVTYEVKLVELQGEKIAGLLSFVYFGRAYLFVTFFDQRYDKVSPGKLIMGAGVEEAFRDPAIKEVSFVGSYTTAKVWTSETRDYRSLRVYGRNIPGRIAYLNDRRSNPKANSNRHMNV